MIFPPYTDDTYWNNIIKEYIDNGNTHPSWYNIEDYMWEYFKNCLKRKNRFFFQHPILPVIKSDFERHVCILPRGTEIYRARIDHDNKLWSEWMDYIKIDSTPGDFKKLEELKYPQEKLEKMQKEYAAFLNESRTQSIKQRIESGFQGFDAKGSSAPPSEFARAGRCNPEGVSYLYAAQEEHTAIAEIRPFIKDIVSIATLKPCHDLRLVNFDYNPSDIVKGKNFLFNNIQKDFTQINKTQNGDYFITQFIASLVEHLGYDGLCFKSSLAKAGTNYVIFNPEHCQPVSSKLCYLSDVKYVYGQCK